MGTPRQFWTQFAKGRNNHKLLTINVGTELKILSGLNHHYFQLYTSPFPFPFFLSIPKYAHKFRVSAQVLNKIRGSFYDAQFYLPHVAVILILRIHSQTHSHTHSALIRIHIGHGIMLISNARWDTQKLWWICTTLSPRLPPVSLYPRWAGRIMLIAKSELACKGFLCVCCIKIYRLSAPRRVCKLIVASEKTRAAGKASPASAQPEPTAIKFVLAQLWLLAGNWVASSAIGKTSGRGQVEWSKPGHFYDNKRNINRPESGRNAIVNFATANQISAAAIVPPTPHSLCLPLSLSLYAYYL